MTAIGAQLPRIESRLDGAPDVEGAQGADRIASPARRPDLGLGRAAPGSARCRALLGTGNRFRKVMSVRCCRLFGGIHLGSRPNAFSLQVSARWSAQAFDTGALSGKGRRSFEHLDSLDEELTAIEETEPPQARPSYDLSLRVDLSGRIGSYPIETLNKPRCAATARSRSRKGECSAGPASRPTAPVRGGGRRASDPARGLVRSEPPTIQASGESRWDGKAPFGR